MRVTDFSLDIYSASYIALRSSGTILAPRADFRRVGERKKEKANPRKRSVHAGLLAPIKLSG
jgi:hypothetical protein